MRYGWQVTVRMLITSARIAGAPAAISDGSFAPRSSGFLVVAEKNHGQPFDAASP